MTMGAEVWGPALIQAAGSIGGGFLSGRGGSGKESKLQKTQRHLIDQLIASLTGDGPFSHLFNADEESFQKSFVDPAKKLFSNQIAPQIQQQFIASGQQRGTGLDDTLTRAGVDLDSILNQHMYQYMQDAQNRSMGAINSILGGGAGAPTNPSNSQNLMSSLGGYLSSQGFADTAANLFKPSAGPAKTPNDGRKGFEPTT